MLFSFPFCLNWLQVCDTFLLVTQKRNASYLLTKDLALTTCVIVILMIYAKKFFSQEKLRNSKVATFIFFLHKFLARHFFLCFVRGFQSFIIPEYLVTVNDNILHLMCNIFKRTLLLVYSEFIPYFGFLQMFRSRSQMTSFNFGLILTSH